MLKQILLLLSTAAMVAFAVPANAANMQTGQSNYCANASLELSMSNDNATLQKVYETCKPGDTVLIGEGAAAEVMRLCDFTKTIATGGGNIYCVLAPLRPVR